MSTGKRRPYSKKFKERAVDLIENGTAVPRVASDFEVKAEKESEREIARLKQENERLKLDNLIFTKNALLSAATPLGRIPFF